MTESEILKLMNDLKTERNHPAWPEFVRQMQTRFYGYDALYTAWAWFKTGWDEAESDT